MNDDDLVTVDSFVSSTAASLAKARLEGNGITCYVANKISGAMEDPLGATQLQVRRVDVARAREILAEQEPYAEMPNHPADGPVCPKCNEQYAYRERAVTKTIVSVLRGRRPAEVWRCRKCNNQWPT